MAESNRSVTPLCCTLLYCCLIIRTDENYDENNQVIVCKLRKITLPQEAVLRYGRIWLNCLGNIPITNLCPNPIDLYSAQVPAHLPTL